MLMGSPTIQEAQKLKSNLDNFSVASSTTINENKSQIFFFNTPLWIHLNIAKMLGFQISSLPTKYLDVPLSDNSQKKSSWTYLISSLESILSSYTCLSLNAPARLILLKSVLQSIPLYLFFVLDAPKIILKRVPNIQMNFPWHKVNATKKWALVASETLCLPKNMGSLGIRDPEKLSDIIGAKIWWRWLKNNTDL